MKPLRNRQSALTFTELLVAVLLVVVAVLLAAVAFLVWAPHLNNTNLIGNARQIALALRLYASDYQGVFPSWVCQNGNPTTVPVKDSNTAFAQLFPNYVRGESLFWVKGSAFCTPNPPDEITDNPPLDIPVNTLKSGENEWAYVLQLTDESNPGLPLIADGFANPVAHTYASDPSEKGGVWKGRKAIIVHVDGSGIIANVDQATMTVTGSNGSATPGDIFTTANAANGWLAPENIVVNPK